MSGLQRINWTQIDSANVPSGYTVDIGNNNNPINNIYANDYYSGNTSLNDLFINEGTLDNGILTLKSPSGNTVNITGFTSENIYNSNGSLNNNRILNLNGYSLTFSGSTYVPVITSTGQLILGNGNYVGVQANRRLRVNDGTASFVRTIVRTVDTGTNSYIAHQLNSSDLPQIEILNTWNGFGFNTGTRFDILDNTSNVSNTGALNFNFFGVNNNTPMTNRPLLTINNGPGVGIFNTSILKIFNNGNVTLNTNNDSGYKLDVNGTARISNKLRLDTVNQNNDDTKLLTLGTNNEVNYLPLDNITNQKKKILLRKIDLGGRKIIQVPDSSLLNSLVGILYGREYPTQKLGDKVDFYYTINDSDNIRKNVLFVTQEVGVNYSPQDAFTDIIDHITSTYGYPITVGFYVEIYIEVESNILSPNNFKLVNPLFNSLRTNKYTTNRSYNGRTEFIKRLKGNDIYDSFSSGFDEYYTATTSNDIVKQISNIVSEPNFYGSLSGYANNVINVDSWNDQVRDVVKVSTFVEDVKNFYGKFKIPINQHGFYQENLSLTNNFYGELLYDISSGNTNTFQTNAHTDLFPTQAVLQLIDTYRVLPTGDIGLIYSENSGANIRLNNLRHSIGIDRKIKYLNTYAGREYNTYIQVLPGYNDTYAVKFNVSGDIGVDNAQNYLNNFIKNNLEVNDESLKIKNNTLNQYWSNFTSSNTASIFSNETNFNNNPYGKYAILQSNDEKMYQLSQNPTVTYTSLTENQIYVGGIFSSFNNQRTNYISNINLTNTGFTSYEFDNGFNVGGIGFNGLVLTIAVQSDGKILCGGYFTQYTDKNGTVNVGRIIRLNPNGTIDTTFNSGGIGFNAGVNDIKIQNDGKILCGGNFGNYNGVGRSYIVRLNSDGSFDTTFNLDGVGFNAIVSTIAIQSDGKILCGGDFENYDDQYGSYSSQRIARLNSDGTFDTTFNSGGYGFNANVSMIKIQSDGKILVSGAYTQYSDINGTYYGNKIARLNSDGTFDTTFENGIGFGFDFIAYSLSIQQDGKILVGGAFSQYTDSTGTYNMNGIVRLNSNGTFDTSFNPGDFGFNNTGTVYEILIQSDNKIICVGNFTNYSSGGVLRVKNHILRLNSDGTFDRTFNISGTGPNSNIEALALQSDGKILVGGWFDQYTDGIGNHSMNNILRLNSTGAYDYGDGFNNNVNKIIRQSDGKILVGGEFTQYTYSGFTYNSYGIARLNSDKTFDTTFQNGSDFEKFYGFNLPVKTMAVQNDGKILVGGLFSDHTDDTGTYTTNGIARLNSDGTIDSTFNSGGIGFGGIEYISIESIKIQNDGKILVGGWFNSYNDNSGTYSLVNILRLNSDGTFDTTFNNGGTGCDDTVYDIEIQNDGKILCGGTFAYYTDVNNSYNMYNILRLNSDGTFDTSFNSGGTGFNYGVYSITIQQDGKILCGGLFNDFTDINGTYPMNNIARLNSDGTFDTTFNNGGTGFNGEVRTIEILYNNRILVGGNFTTYGNYDPNNIVLLNTDGQFLDSLNLGYNDTVNTLIVNPLFTYPSISVDAIYKGHSFRPLVYPLNLTQLLFEIPKNYIFSNGNVQSIKNYDGNEFIYDENTNLITNKSLRFLLYFKDIKKYEIVETQIYRTITNNDTYNKVFSLSVNNIEQIIKNGLSENRKRSLKPNNVEIYMSFFDVNTNKTSMVSNYKIIVAYYGNNEIFKLIRGGVDSNFVTP